MAGAMCSPIARSSASQRIVPSVRSPARRSIIGPRAAISTGVGVEVGDVERVVHLEVVVVHVDRPGTGQRLVEHVEVGAQGGDRPLVGQAEHVLDHPVVRHAQPERQPALAHRLGGERLLGQRDRVPRLHRHDRGADLDAGGLRAHQRGRGEGVEVVGDLRDPHRRQAGLLGPAGVGAQAVHLGAVPAPLRTQHHPDPHPDHPSSSLRTPFLQKCNVTSDASVPVRGLLVTRASLAGWASSGRVHLRRERRERGDHHHHAHARSAPPARPPSSPGPSRAGTGSGSRPRVEGRRSSDAGYSEAEYRRQRHRHLLRVRVGRAPSPTGCGSSSPLTRRPTRPGDRAPTRRSRPRSTARSRWSGST